MFKIKLKRLKKHIADKDLAKRVGVSVSTISRIRTGFISMPKWDEGEKILKVYREFYPKRK